MKPKSKAPKTPVCQKLTDRQKAAILIDLARKNLRDANTEDSHRDTCPAASIRLASWHRGRAQAYRTAARLILTGFLHRDTPKQRALYLARAKRGNAACIVW